MNTWRDKQGDRPTLDTATDTDRNRERTELRCAWALVAVAALLGGAHAPAASAGQVQVYRCEGVEGAVEFRQKPCPLDQPGEAVTIEDHTTGWTPAPQAAEPTAAPKTKKKHTPKRRSGPSASERKQETCGKKRDQLEDINRTLRLGVNGRQSTNLRHRRRRLEDYLFHECD